MIFRQFEGLFPMPEWQTVGLPQSWAWTLLAPYISSCPWNQTRLIWQNFPVLHVLNRPNSDRINGADVWNETTGGWANTAATTNITVKESCIDAPGASQDCNVAISQNRSIPLSYPGRHVFFQWDAPGHPVGPNKSHITSTNVAEPKFAAWVSQLNVSMADRTAYTVQPNVSTWEHDAAINSTMFVALTDLDLYVTPANISMLNPHVAALAVYQAG